MTLQKTRCVDQLMELGWRRWLCMLCCCASCAKATPFVHWWAVRGIAAVRVRSGSKFKHPKCQLRASGPGYRGTGGSEEFQEWASDHVSPWIDGRMKSDEIWKLWVFDFRVARYTTVIKTTPFFDRTKNYIYNGVLTSFLVTKASLSSRISGLERWPHGLMNLNLSEVCQFVLHPSA